MSRDGKDLVNTFNKCNCNAGLSWRSYWGLFLKSLSSMFVCRFCLVFVEHTILEKHFWSTHKSTGNTASAPVIYAWKKNTNDDVQIKRERWEVCLQTRRGRLSVWITWPTFRYFVTENCVNSGTIRPIQYKVANKDWNSCWGRVAACIITVELPTVCLHKTSRRFKAGGETIMFQHFHCHGATTPWNNVRCRGIDG